jgi:hypothetical protein
MIKQFQALRKLGYSDELIKKMSEIDEQLPETISLVGKRASTQTYKDTNTFLSGKSSEKQYTSKFLVTSDRQKQ